MAGIPARVATGFTTGAFDEKEKEYVVRDLDAHSWVEAWFPGIGWVTRDPTPAAAPARSQPGDNRSELPNAGNQTAPDLGGERLERPREQPLARARRGRQHAHLDPLRDRRDADHDRRGAAPAASRPAPPAARARPLADFERALERAGVDGPTASR